MDINLHHAGIDLPGRGLLTLSDARGATVMCLAGEIWITQPNDRRDYILGAGECLTIAAAGKTLIQAGPRARLVLLEQEQSPAEAAPRRMPGGRMLLAEMHAA